MAETFRQDFHLALQLAGGLIAMKASSIGK
jgi:hypothetical protein